MFLTINTKIFIPSNDVKNAIVPEKIKVIGDIFKLSPIIVFNNKYTEEDNIAKEPINIENLTLVFLSRPKSKPALTVIPDLDIPGNSASI